MRTFEGSFFRSSKMPTSRTETPGNETNLQTQNALPWIPGKRRTCDSKRRNRKFESLSAPRSIGRSSMAARRRNCRAFLRARKWFDRSPASRFHPARRRGPLAPAARAVQRVCEMHSRRLQETSLHRSQQGCPHRPGRLAPSPRFAGTISIKLFRKCNECCEGTAASCLSSRGALPS